MWAHNSLRIKRLKEVFIHQQNSICKLSLRSAQLSEKKLIKLLSLLPHLEELSLELCLTKVSKISMQRLSHLKKLKSFKCCAQAASIIFELKNDVLKQLSFDDGGLVNSQLSCYTPFLKSKRTLKNSLSIRKVWTHQFYCHSSRSYE